MSSTIDATMFNPDTDIKYSKPKVNPSGGKSVNILNAHTNKSLYLSTPLILTWGVGEFVDEKSGKKTYDMALQFPQEDFRTEATDKFLKSIEALQKKIKADAIVNSKEWMNKAKMSEDVVEALFHPMLKYSKDPETGEPNMTRSPTLKVKLSYYDSKFDCEVYDMQSKLIFPNEHNSDVSPVDLITKASHVAVVLQCGGIWFANGKFGCTWRLLQAVVQPKPSMKGKCLISLPSSEDKSRSTKEASVMGDEEEDDEKESLKQSTTQSLTIAEDSDEEDEHPVVLIQEPVVVAVKEPEVKKEVKKIIKKKV